MEYKHKKDLLIIIPAYNEAKNIQNVLNNIEKKKLITFGDVLIINDGSQDSTSQIVKQNQYPLISHLYNLGYGCALQSGYQYALRAGYQYVIQMDGDSQHDVSNIALLYKKLKEADENGQYPDIVLGTRYAKNSPAFPTPLSKKIAYFLFRSLIYRLTKESISDPTTGLQGLSRRAFGYYSKANHFDDRYPDAHILIQMLLLKFKVVEVPALMYTRTQGKSMHSGMRPIWYMLRSLYSIASVVFCLKVLKGTPLKEEYE